LTENHDNADDIAASDTGSVATDKPLTAREDHPGLAKAGTAWNGVTRRSFLGGLSAAMVGAMGVNPLPLRAADPNASSPPVLFTNLKLFDGVNLSVRTGINVLVEKNRIAALPAVGQAVDNAQTIDCGGRLLMPGLIDAHWHAMFCAITEARAMRSTVGYLYLVAAQEAERTLMRGFTSVRDVGGPSFDLKRAIDEGIATGPRIYPSGAMISQTSGHGDFRLRSEVPRSNAGALSYAEQIGAAAIADGSSEVLRRVREQLMLGASQIKLMAGGGVSSPYDPLDTTQYSEEELRAAVGAAEDWGTYVMVHVYNPRGIKRAVRAGVKSIEHGQLADEESARIMAGEGVWWSLQPFLADDDANFKIDPNARAKQLQVAEGTRRAYHLARDLGIKTAWGTDILFTPNNLSSQGRQLAKLIEFYPSLELLQIATAKNGELLDLSGERNPYRAKVGVIEPGALADLLIVDGDPTQNLDFLGEPDKNLQLIMKDGSIYKNLLSAS
jgi:imidazolonepropionase-like amidohydrolase